MDRDELPGHDFLWAARNKRADTRQTSEFAIREYVTESLRFSHPRERSTLPEGPRFQVSVNGAKAFYRRIAWTPRERICLITVTHRNAGNDDR